MRCMLLLAALVIAGCRPTVTLTEAQRILQKQQAELNRLESNRNELKYELEQNKLVPGISRKEYVEQIERLTELIEHQQKRVDNAQALVDRLSPNLD